MALSFKDKLEKMKPEILKRKRVLIPAGILGIIVLIILLSLPSSTKQSDSGRQKTGSDTSATPQFSSGKTPPNEQDSLIKETISKQQKVDREYSEWQTDTRTKFPWKKHLPLYSDKYYVYFDLKKEIFVGRLYPKAGDNVETIKADAVRRLKEVSVPADNYGFDWQVFSG